jgi:regulator of sigma E protease
MLAIAQPIAPDFLARTAAWAQTVPGGDFVFTVGLFVALLGVLIFIHELGHYWAARHVGIKVLAFSVGFGKAIVSWEDKHGTYWKIGWLPLGGYVQMLGQEDLKPSQRTGQRGHYMSKTIAQRAYVIVAGPFANLLLGLVVLWGAMLLGEQKLQAEVGEVLPTMPAMGILQKGDMILSLDGQNVMGWDELQRRISENTGVPAALQVQRGEGLLALTITPQVQTHTDVFGDEHRVGRLGIAPSGATFTIERNPLEALVRAAVRTYEYTALTLKSLWKLLTGAIGADNLTGPLGIANITGQTAHTGFYALLMLTALITINLCIVNLFPIPVLDGGHLVLLAIEQARGKPLGAMAQEWAFRVGLLCILMLAALSTFNDVKRLGFLPGENTPSAEQGGRAVP